MASCDKGLTLRLNLLHFAFGSAPIAEVASDDACGYRAGGRHHPCRVRVPGGRLCEPLNPDR